MSSLSSTREDDYDLPNLHECGFNRLCDSHHLLFELAPDRKDHRVADLMVHRYLRVYLVCVHSSPSAADSLSEKEGEA